MFVKGNAWDALEAARQHGIEPISAMEGPLVSTTSNPYTELHVHSSDYEKVQDWQNEPARFLEEPGLGVVPGTCLMFQARDVGSMRVEM